jgi:hypothetical protein
MCPALIIHRVRGSSPGQLLWVVFTPLVIFGSCSGDDGRIGGAGSTGMFACEPGARPSAPRITGDLLLLMSM